VNNLGIIDEIGTSPCVFKLNSNFYDFTPIKVKYPEPIFPYLEGKAKVEKKDLEAPQLLVRLWLVPAHRRVEGSALLPRGLLRWQDRWARAEGWR